MKIEEVKSTTRAGTDGWDEAASASPLGDAASNIGEQCRHNSLLAALAPDVSVAGARLSR